MIGYKSLHKILIITILSGHFSLIAQYDVLKFQHFNIVDGLSQNTVRTIIQDKYGFIWIGTVHGLNRYDGYNFKIYKSELGNPNSLNSNRCKIAFLDNNGTMWVQTYEGVFNRYNYDTDNFTRFSSDEVSDYIREYHDKYMQEKVKFVYKNHLIEFLFEAEDRHFYYTDLNTGIITPSITNPKDPYSLRDSYVTNIYVDSYNVFWVGTWSSGISKADLNRKKIKLYMNISGGSNGLISNNIREIFEDEYGNLWIGTRSSGITKFNRKNQTYKHYQHKSNCKNSLVSNEIREIYKDNLGMFWFGTKHGLDMFNPETEKFTNILRGTGTERGTWIFDVIEDHLGFMWFASFEGLYKYDRTSKQMILYGQDDSTIIEKSLRFVHEDINLDIWVGSENGGITRLKRINPNVFKEKFESTHFINDTANIKSLSSNLVYSMREDENGTLWFGTGNGLNKFNKTDETFDHYTMKEGLPDDFIIGMVSDGKGHLWLSHKRGISRFNIKTEEVKNYSVIDGLQDLEFNEDAYSISKRTGEIFFGGPNGFNAFFADSITENKTVPKVYITGLEINDEQVGIRQKVEGTVVLEKNIILTKEITLNHHHKRIAIEFAGIHYANPVKNKYKYMLEGFDNKWINAKSDHRKAVYSNLDPKTYYFKVKASNNDGVWNEEATSIRIIVTPPFWETWWFKSAIVFIVAIIIFTIYLIRVSSLRKQKILLEKKVDLRTKELKKAYDNIRNISEFGQKITSTLDFKAINEMIYDYVKSFMDTFDFGIGIYIPDKEVIEYRMFYEDGKLIAPYECPFSIKNSFSVYCVEKQKTIFINDLENEYKIFMPKLPDFSASRFPNSLINIPLTVKEKKIGLLAINSVKKNVFTKNDLLKLQTLAAYIAIALDNSESHTTLWQKNKMLLEKQEKIKEQRNLLNETNTILEERQQRIEEQSEELQAQAEELFVTNENLKSSNATKDKLFSIIAHDLKNPFTSVIGFSEMIIKKWDRIENKKMKHMIETIHSSAKSIYSLLDNLLQWSRSQMGNIKFDPEKISLYNLTKENIVLLSNLITQKNILIKLDIPNDLYCYADNQMIKTVIRNILTNAIKFTENGTITINSEIKENMVNISINDTGVGIAEDKLNNLFEMEKAKSTHGTRGEQGTGLGLIICKEFIKKNNGQIYVKSEINKGTTFIFTLPLKDQKTSIVN